MKLSSLTFQLLLAALLSVAAIPALAEDDGFFQQGFAGNVIDKGAGNDLPTQPVPKMPSSKAAPSKQAEPQQQSDGFIEGGADAEPSDPSGGIAPKVDADDASAIPILGIDGVINFTKPEHARAELEALAGLIQIRNLRINKIYALGATTPVLASIDQKVRVALVSAISKFVRANAVPQDLSLKGSPSWIFYTEKGRYIAEGSDALERVTTSSGKLRWPKNAGAPVYVPTPPGEEKKQADNRSANERIHDLVDKLNSSPKPHRR